MVSQARKSEGVVATNRLKVVCGHTAFDQAHSGSEQSGSCTGQCQRAAIDENYESKINCQVDMAAENGASKDSMFTIYANAPCLRK